MISLTRGLTSWVDKSMSSVFLIICIACVDIVGSFIVGVRVCLTTTVITVVIVSTFRVIWGLVFFSFELMAQDSIVTWVFCSGGKLVGAFLSFVAWLVASQFSFAVHLGLPNHSVLTPFQDSTQSVYECHFLNALG